MRSPIAHPPPFDRLHPGDLPAGTQVGPWRVLALRDRGASGAVYQAVPIEQLEGPPVALKLALEPQDPRFLREAEILRRIAHPSVPRLEELGLWAHAAGPFPYLAMDWVEGLPLYTWAREHPLRSRQVLEMLVPVASALAAAHAAKCVHRDVKGDNILVRAADSRPMLVDFGAGDFFKARPLTREPLPPGTPFYRSPEAFDFLWRHRHQHGAHYQPGPADDVYALGVTAYFLVTGAYPAPVLPPEYLEREPFLAGRTWEPPEEQVTVSPELAALIHQMLSVAPSARGSAAQVMEALERAARTAGPRADQPIVQRPPGPRTMTPRAEGRGPAARVARPPENPPLEERPIAESAARKSMTSPRRSLRRLWPWLSALAGAFILCVLQSPWVERPGPSTARPQQHRDGADAETSGLGEDAVRVRAKTEGPEPSGTGIKVEFPNKPLPGQALPPCKGREVEINKGCWGRPENPRPPCGERNYEWRGLCYYPVLAPAPPATSKQK